MGVSQHATDVQNMRDTSAALPAPPPKLPYTKANEHPCWDKVTRETCFDKELYRRVDSVQTGCERAWGGGQDGGRCSATHLPRV